MKRPIFVLLSILCVLLSSCKSDKEKARDIIVKYCSSCSVIKKAGETHYEERFARLAEEAHEAHAKACLYTEFGKPTEEITEDDEYYIKTYVWGDNIVKLYTLKNKKTRRYSYEFIIKD